jgi:hypothetical protein
MKSIRLLILAFFLFSVPEVFSQNDGMVNAHKRERKRVWRKWNRKKDAYNPYLKKKNKDKPSVQASRANEREIRRQRRDYKRQLKRAKKNAR